MRTAKTILITSFAALAAAAPAPAADPGGASSSAPPAPRSVSCHDACADLDSAKPGSTLRVYGRSLEQVRTVVFMGSSAAGDDVTARVAKARSHTVYVVVPPTAVGGPLTLVNGDGTASAPTKPVAIDRGPTKVAAPGTVPGVDARVDSRRTFFDGRKPAALRYLVKGDSAVRVTIALVRAGTETVVASWSPGLVEPGSTRSVRWNGIDANTKQSGVRGRYEFRVYTSSSTAGPSNARSAQSTRPSAARSFLFLDHQFPIRGRHVFGDGANRFGAGRNGHVHEGQDVMAKCGLPLVAARGGTVKFAGYQGNAGNYIVINGQATGVDYAYMHLAQPALFKKGAVVHTGDQIGLVGDTGDATACHLHFEEWSAPGWYTGGRAFDPLPDLRAWDKYS